LWGEVIKGGKRNGGWRDVALWGEVIKGGKSLIMEVTR
jgi:hypothetical protein